MSGTFPPYMPHPTYATPHICHTLYVPRRIGDTPHVRHWMSKFKLKFIVKKISKSKSQTQKSRPETNTLDKTENRSQKLNWRKMQVKTKRNWCFRFQIFHENHLYMFLRPQTLPRCFLRFWAKIGQCFFVVFLMKRARIVCLGAWSDDIVK